MSLALRATGSGHQFDIKGSLQTHYYPAIRYPAIRNPAIRYPAGNYPVSIRNPVSGKKPIRYIPNFLIYVFLVFLILVHEVYHYKDALTSRLILHK